MRPILPTIGGDDRYSQTCASSLARARIWFFAACSLSETDRLSGGPSVPTFTRPDISPRADENVNVNDPRASASKRRVSTLHTPVSRRKPVLGHPNGKTSTAAGSCRVRALRPKNLLAQQNRSCRARIPTYHATYASPAHFRCTRPFGGTPRRWRGTRSLC